LAKVSGPDQVSYIVKGVNLVVRIKTSVANGIPNFLLNLVDESKTFFKLNAWRGS
jgi:hypothetical protein